MNGKVSVKSLIWFGLGALLLVLLAQSWWQRSDEGKPRTIAARGDLAADEQATIDIFNQNSPSVVYITTVDQVLNIWTRDVSEIPSGTGTGFVWDESGHIVTNNHVIEGKKTAKVRLSDQRVFDAVVVGASAEHDLAVLKLQNTADAPPPVTIGTSADLQVGQKVFAIGNPFGLDHSLTSGIISALGRSIDSGEEGSMSGLIQTDTAINPGNSGGPLLDSAGRVIGVNVAIYSPSGASAGIGFASPVDVVNRVVPRLVKDGRYTRPVLGITLDDSVSRAINQKLDTQGVLVLEVAPGTPAAVAGIRGTQVDARGELLLGDIIQAIDGKPVTSADELTMLLDQYAPRSNVVVSLLRDGKTRQDVTLVLDVMR